MKNQFEDWIQESAPAVEVDDTKKEIHLAILKQRLRERESRHKTRQKGMRRTSVAFVVLVFVLIGGNVSELGSDGFDLVISENELGTDLSHVEIGFRKSGLGVPDEMPHDEVQELAMQIEAQNGTPAEVEVIKLQGNEFWTILFEYEVGDGTRLSGHTVKDRPSKPTRAHVNFSKAEIQLMWDEINSGNLSPVSSRIETVDGYRFLMKVYHYQSDQFGLVEYQKGIFIR
jgi:hypothetical protein